ncbi:uncharacterized protein EV422DRAFT_209732 [Fimicolochytrium jonesii]|uniref:uncharacterized protein n=1 Tax=Fimicolochytrium jonesii TaxID=1396493 RepID=UPI0022FE598D|nr:uncharacterized protein EV422DRAFT_209732 [Fimicolochytrium jonesii]KAI8817628.1 hypothetical protein EV422DRAFT_209732 [Fimicolochytrium jonesii]
MNPATRCGSFLATRPARAILLLFVIGVLLRSLFLATTTTTTAPNSIRLSNSNNNAAAAAAIPPSHHGPGVVSEKTVSHGTLVVPPSSAGAGSADPFPSKLTNDRPVILKAWYRDGEAKLDVTRAVKKLHIGRRLRISTQVNLYEHFGDAKALALDVTYSYRGIDTTQSVDVVTKAEGLVFLKTDLIIPPNLVDDDMPEKNVGLHTVLNTLRGKNGLEIGGSSDPFRNVLPIYSVISSLDNSNFAATTLWENELKDGQKTFQWHPNKEMGVQHVVDVTDMSKLRAIGKPYDFVAACHMLEHIANPLRAVTQMVSVLKPGGHLFLVLPYKKLCFDQYRDYTPMSDLLSHYERGTQEHEPSEHFDEIMMLHDLSMDAPAGTLAHFRSRSLRNEDVRGIHQHVFSYELLEQVCKWAGLNLVVVDRIHLHMFVLCQKPAA